MKIMLVMSNYVKKYASTIYQRLVLSTPLPFSLNDRLPLPCLIKLATLGGSRIEIAFGSILIQRDLRFSD